MKSVKVIHAPDGKAIYKKIQEYFANSKDIIVDDDLKTLPAAHSKSVAVFIITENSINDENFVSYLQKLIKIDLPIIPLVRSIAQYDFSAMPEAYHIIKRLNAVGWDQGLFPGEIFFSAIKKYLGMMPFKRDCKVFISYRRTDGKGIASAVHEHLKSTGFRVFLDTIDMELGVKVEKVIGEEICEQDFLLLIDTPDASKSSWVFDEIMNALEHCISVCALRHPQSEGFPLLRNMPGIDWNEKDPDPYKKIEEFISRAIASKSTFDVQVDRTLKELAYLYKLDLHPIRRRQLILSKQVKGGDSGIFIEFEDALLNIERLYRLHNNYTMFKDKTSKALFLYNGLPLSDFEKEAIEWARGKSPIFAYSIREIKHAIASIA